jgi:hypothetical protein
VTIFNLTGLVSSVRTLLATEFVKKWRAIDNLLTIGYARNHRSWRISRQLRSLRKATAHVTGFHGLLSGKKGSFFNADTPVSDDVIDMNNRRKRKRKRQSRSLGLTDVERRRREAGRLQRVNEIDRQMIETQVELLKLASEKDVLQGRPNPLWNYTMHEIQLDVNTEHTDDEKRHRIEASRTFDFPASDLVEEYLDFLLASGRLQKLNHTDLWRTSDDLDASFDDDDDDLTLLRLDEGDVRQRNRVGRSSGDSGSWFLRHGLGEKVGEAAEKAAYRSVCTSIMSVLARGLSSMHGVSVFSHADIRLFMEQAPDLPQFSTSFIPGSSFGSNYAESAIHEAIQRGSRKHRRNRLRKYQIGEKAFIQREAVVETMLSHCQLSAPLLKLFPLAWQRAMLSNIISLITAVVQDFCDGVQFQILGHRLSLLFTPITEEDMMRHLRFSGSQFGRFRASAEVIEGAIQATAADLSENLKFLDKWHERALGSGILRAQIANLIARLVLNLVDDVLSGAQLDLWASQAGGPRLYACIEPRVLP